MLYCHIVSKCYLHCQYDTKKSDDMHEQLDNCFIVIERPILFFALISMEFVNYIFNYKMIYEKQLKSLHATSRLSL